ncbi:MAG: VWA domain-containing protein [Polyangiaceae bacterium]|nr:VWA domain-containing protein [Polyangiaceae bacterium]
MGLSLLLERDTVVRTFGELFWFLRRKGFSFSISKVIDAYRALALIGLGDKGQVQEALALTLLSTREERERFDAVFGAYFERAGERSVWDKLVALGFREEEMEEIREQFAMNDPSETAAAGSFALFLEGGAEFARLMQLGIVRRAEELRSLAQLGAVSERAADAIGVTTAIDALSNVGLYLRDRFGERGARAEELFRQELLLRKSEIRDELRGHANKAEARETQAETASDKNFADLDAAEYEEVRRAVRQLAERLRGGELVRRKRARAGKIDAHRTIRAALRTGGVPFRLYRLRKRRTPAKLVLLCDISDSVKAAATFMLQFVAASHDLFERVRSFVFVSEVGETSELFAKAPMKEAIARAFSGEVVPVVDNSNYGLALLRFHTREKRSLDRRTTLVVLGDGRSNYADAGIEVLASLRTRVKRIVWICPERERHWGRADSAILKIAPHCDAMLEAACASDLEGAMRELMRVSR